MRVEEVMTKDPVSCRRADTLDRAARVMWDRDCGFVPIVDDGGRVIGALTDRDAVMAAYTRGARLADVCVSTAMATPVVTCGRHDDIEYAESLMQRYQIRRLPVVDGDGRLIGLLSLDDLARGAAPADVGRALLAICASSRRPLGRAR